LHLEEYYRNKRKCALGIDQLGTGAMALRHPVRGKVSWNRSRNKILVDIQGRRFALYQIFTSSLQRQPGRAPFFEFIQRVCSECTDTQGCPQKVRPGCVGVRYPELIPFHQVNKTMQDISDAKVEGDNKKHFLCNENG
jgi:hypothetical protein